MDPTSVERQPSGTALAAVFLRALANSEKLKGPDDTAKIYLTPDYKSILQDPSTREWVLKNRIPRGMYEYIFARTSYFDHIVKRALVKNIPQIVFLGAGYDSRPYRFRELIETTRIFELDIQTTQQRKRELLDQAGIKVPDQLAFVPINFKTDNLADVLFNAGYDSREETLYVWEGVTFYLSAAVVDQTLSLIKLHSTAGSTICFDCSELSPNSMDEYGVRELVESMKLHHAGEAVLFGIQKGGLESFLSERGYVIKEYLNVSDMERKYLTREDGSLAGRVTALFCFVLAEVVA
jgi:methyltransferase (TIGR00027 family)